MAEVTLQERAAQLGADWTVIKELVKRSVIAGKPQPASHYLDLWEADHKGKTTAQKQPAQAAPTQQPVAAPATPPWVQPAKPDTTQGIGLTAVQARPVPGIGISTSPWAGFAVKPNIPPAGKPEVFGMAPAGESKSPNAGRALQERVQITDEQAKAGAKQAEKLVAAHTAGEQAQIDRDLDVQSGASSAKDIERHRADLNDILGHVLPNDPNLKAGDFVGAYRNAERQYDSWNEKLKASPDDETIKAKALQLKAAGNMLWTRMTPEEQTQYWIPRVIKDYNGKKGILPKASGFVWALDQGIANQFFPVGGLLDHAIPPKTKATMAVLQKKDPVAYYVAQGIGSALGIMGMGKIVGAAAKAFGGFAPVENTITRLARGYRELGGARNLASARVLTSLAKNLAGVSQEALTFSASGAANQLNQRMEQGLPIGAGDVLRAGVKGIETGVPTALLFRGLGVPLGKAGEAVVKGGAADAPELTLGQTIARQAGRTAGGAATFVGVGEVQSKLETGHWMPGTEVLGTVITGGLLGAFSEWDKANPAYARTQAKAALGTMTETATKFIGEYVDALPDEHISAATKLLMTPDQIRPLVQNALDIALQDVTGKKGDAAPDAVAKDPNLQRELAWEVARRTETNITSVQPDLQNIRGDLFKNITQYMTQFIDNVGQRKNQVAEQTDAASKELAAIAKEKRDGRIQSSEPPEQSKGLTPRVPAVAPNASAAPEKAAEPKVATPTSEPGRSQQEAPAAPAPVAAPGQAEPPAAPGSGETPTGTVYHGGKGDVNLDPRYAGSTTGNPTSVWGVFFTPDAGEAQRYIDDFHKGEGKIIAATLDLKHPYKMSFAEYEQFVRLDLGKDNLDTQMSENRKKATAFKDDLVSKGYDGIVIGEPGKSRPQEYVAFSTEQINQQPSNTLAAPPLPGAETPGPEQSRVVPPMPDIQPDTPSREPPLAATPEGTVPGRPEAESPNVLHEGFSAAFQASAAPVVKAINGLDNMLDMLLHQRDIEREMTPGWHRVDTSSPYTEGPSSRWERKPPTNEELMHQMDLLLSSSRMALGAGHGNPTQAYLGSLNYNGLVSENLRTFFNRSGDDGSLEPDNRSLMDKHFNKPAAIGDVTLGFRSTDDVYRHIYHEAIKLGTLGEKILSDHLVPPEGSPRTKQQQATIELALDLLRSGNQNFMSNCNDVRAYFDRMSTIWKKYDPSFTSRENYLIAHEVEKPDEYDSHSGTPFGKPSPQMHRKYETVIDDWDAGYKTKAGSIGDLIHGYNDLASKAILRQAHVADGLSWAWTPDGKLHYFEPESNIFPEAPTPIQHKDDEAVLYRPVPGEAGTDPAVANRFFPDLKGAQDDAKARKIENPKFEYIVVPKSEGAETDQAAPVTLTAEDLATRKRNLVNFDRMKEPRGGYKPVKVYGGTGERTLKTPSGEDVYAPPDVAKFYGRVWGKWWADKFRFPATTIKWDAGTAWPAKAVEGTPGEETHRQFPIRLGKEEVSFPEVLSGLNYFGKRVRLTASLFHYLAYATNLGLVYHQMPWKIPGIIAKSQALFDDMGPLVEEAMRHGLTSWPREYPALASRSSSPVVRGVRYFDDVLFSRIGQGLKLHGVLTDLAGIVQRNPGISYNTAWDQAVRNGNYIYGNPNLDFMGRGQFARLISSWGLLAPGWTESNFGQDFDALTPGHVWKDPVTKEPLSPAASQARQQEAARFIMKVIATWGTAAVLFNQAENQRKRLKTGSPFGLSGGWPWEGIQAPKDFRGLGKVARGALDIDVTPSLKDITWLADKVAHQMGVGDMLMPDQKQAAEALESGLTQYDEHGDPADNQRFTRGEIDRVIHMTIDQGIPIWALTSDEQTITYLKGALRKAHPDWSDQSLDALARPAVTSQTYALPPWVQNANAGDMKIISDVREARALRQKMKPDDVSAALDASQMLGQTQYKYSIGRQWGDVANLTDPENLIKAKASPFVRVTSELAGVSPIQGTRFRSLYEFKEFQKLAGTNVLNTPMLVTDTRRNDTPGPFDVVVRMLYAAREGLPIPINAIIAAMVGETSIIAMLSQAGGFKVTTSKTGTESKTQYYKKLGEYETNKATAREIQMWKHRKELNNPILPAVTPEKP